MPLRLKAERSFGYPSLRTFLARGAWSTKLTTKEECDWNVIVPPQHVLPQLPNAPEKKQISSSGVKTSKWTKEIEKLKSLQKFSVSWHVQAHTITQKHYCMH